MTNLILDSLKIRNFRAFRNLSIERLGRVNLIVGKNNVGKTCLLEALHLFTNRGTPEVVWDILEARDEGGYNLPRSSNDAEQSLSVKYLFYGRKDITEMPASIQIGPVHAEKDLLSMALGWSTREANKEGVGKYRLLQPEEYNTVEEPVLRLFVQLGKQPISTYPTSGRPFPQLTFHQAVNSIFIGAEGLDKIQVGGLWDSIAISNLEGDVLAALRIIAPDVERLSIIGDQDDIGAIYHLCRHHQIPISVPGRLEPGKITLENGIGVEQILASLKVRLKIQDSDTAVNRLGIIIDADTNIEARWQSLRQILIEAGYKDVPEVPVHEGTVIEEEGLIAVGIWLMPDNQVPGKLENFIQFLVKADDKLWPQADKCINQIPEADRPFSRTDLIKAQFIPG